ncbi:MAG TPA: hypothetical protein DCM05_02810 [Elusimicrobia bacterium]|nr:hypothetical protein [Elusimicrobiota bacterium]
MSLPRWLRHLVRTALHLGLDAGAILLAYWAAYELRFHHAGFTARVPVIGDDPGWELYRRLLFAVVPIWLAIFFYASRLYTRPWLSALDRLLEIFKGAVLGTLAVLAATYIYARLEYSRLMMLMAGPIAALSVSLAQLVVLKIDAWLARHEATSPLLLVGGGKVAELVRGNLLTRHPGMAILEREELPKPDELAGLAAEQGVSDLILVRSGESRTGLLELAEACESADVRFSMIPDLLELRLGEVQMDDSLGLPAYRLQHTSLTRANFAAKRTFDVLFSLLFLACTALPFLLIALLIRLDSKGPVLFQQKRIGYKGRPFEAFKFRTMVLDAEKAVAAVKAASNDQAGGFFKAKNDPRVTRVGRWLRRFSLDEAPQFLNVLAGEMSVVGPRPLALTTGEMEELVRLFGPTAKKRMNILPGITGLWQVSGRSDISSEQRFALDLFYIEHWSLGLDLEIILKTAPAMLFAKGAY